MVASDLVLALALALEGTSSTLAGACLCCSEAGSGVGCRFTVAESGAPLLGISTNPVEVLRGVVAV